jgi:Lon protease-like protein
MKIPLFPLDVVLFPGTPLPLHIFEERYKEMIALCLQENSSFGVVRAQSDGLAIIGCTARIIRLVRRYDDGRMDILCQGEHRFEIETLDNSRSYLQAQVDFFEDEDDSPSRTLKEECLALHFEAMELAGIDAAGMPASLDGPISFLLASNLPADLGFKQQLLNTRSDTQRTEYLREFYNAILPKLRAGSTARKSPAHNGHVM